MKKLSLSEFREYFNALSLNKIIVSTENQSWNSVDSTISVCFEFKKMVITFNPNIIYLNNGENFMQLNKVKLVKLSEAPCLLGKIFTVVCGDSSGKLKDTEYTLIAQ